MIFSTYLGGSASDEGDSLIAEPGGTTLVFVEAISNNLPVTPGTAGTIHNGSQDVCIARLSADGSQLLYGSYFGGNAGDSMPDAIRLIDCRVIFSGQTESTDLPTTVGALDDPNGDDFIDVRDYLYINLDQQGTFP